MVGCMTSESHVVQATLLLEQILLVANASAHLPISLSQRNSMFVQLPGGI